MREIKRFNLHRVMDAQYMRMPRGDNPLHKTVQRPLVAISSPPHAAAARVAVQLVTLVHCTKTVCAISSLHESQSSFSKLAMIRYQKTEKRKISRKQGTGEPEKSGERRRREHAVTTEI